MIKNSIKYTLASITAIVLGACSGGAGFSGDEEQVEVNLVIGEPVEVQKGDTLSPANEDTEINVEHIIGEDIKIVTLLAGKATLVYGDYALEKTN